MDSVKDNWQVILIATLLGAGGGQGVNSILSPEHEHPAIIAQIRSVQYDSEIFKLSTQLEAMESSGQKDTPGYKVAEAQLIKFTQMQQELQQ